MRHAVRDTATQFHKWYYESKIWEHTTYLGIPCWKSVVDLWNYQEIISERRPALVVEFGTLCGGATLYFANLMRAIGIVPHVLTVDIQADRIDSRVRTDPGIEILTQSSTNDLVAARIREIRRHAVGPMFAILDSDHRMPHVLAEMISLRTVVQPGDYIVVEDGNLNGHPVVPRFGPGPLEALAEYRRLYPEDYLNDVARETKFGFTFAPTGFLIKS